MATVSSLEDSIVNLLVNAPQRELSEEKLLNEVVERMGNAENPLRLEDYQHALGSLVDQRIIYQAEIVIDGYEPSSTEIKPGYRLS